MLLDESYLQVGRCGLHPTQIHTTLPTDVCTTGGPQHRLEDPLSHSGNDISTKDVLRPPFNIYIPATAYRQLPTHSIRRQQLSKKLYTQH